MQILVNETLLWFFYFCLPSSPVAGICLSVAVITYSVTEPGWRFCCSAVHFIRLEIGSPKLIRTAFQPA